MISADGKGTVFPVKLKLQRESFNKDITKGIFKKDLINLIEANHQTDNSVSSNNTFKSHLNAKRSNTLAVVQSR